MTTETAPQAAPPPPVASPWMLYRYDGLAYFAHGGRLIATATATTRAQEARVAAMFARLSDQAGRA